AGRPRSQRTITDLGREIGPVRRPSLDGFDDAMVATRAFVTDLPHQSQTIDLHPAGARIVLVVAIAVFLLQGWSLTGALPVWHEEVSVHPTHSPAEITIADGVARAAGICDDDAWIAFSGARPLVALCVGGLAWPILVSPYIGGIHYWPLQLLRPLH